MQISARSPYRNINLHVAVLGLLIGCMFLARPATADVAQYHGTQDTLIYAYITNGGGNMTCAAFSVNKSTGSVYDSDSLVASNSGTQSMLLRVKSGGSNVYHVQCLMTPRSYMRGFYMNEP